MNDAFYELSSSPNTQVDGLLGDVLIDEESEHFNEIDLYNEDTFGSGAVEEDWELDHKQLVELEPYDFSSQHNNCSAGVSIPHKDVSKVDGDNQKSVHPLLSPSQLNEEELEQSNRQLAAAVEDLVITSDQDQDAIDPAIVSLRKQAAQPYSAFASIPKLPPHYQSGKPNLPSGNDLSLLFGKNVSKDFTNQNSIRGNFEVKTSSVSVKTFLEDVLKQKGWNENQNLFDISMLTGDKLPSNGLPLTVPHPADLEDDAIVTAVRDKPAPPSGRPLVMKAEDLEREMQNSSSMEGVFSPFGVSIPKQSEASEASDRSLPARSVSPVFGSPSPSTMPIGTPPKHIIMNMMHQLELQQKDQQRKQNPTQTSGSSGAITRPPMPAMPGLPPPAIPLFLNHPPPPFNGARVPLPRPPNMMWPRGTVGPPVNTMIAQDVINRIGLRMPGSPLRSPIGSPHTFGPLPSPMMAGPNVIRPLPIPQSGVNRNMLRQNQGVHGFSQRYPRSPQKFGPGLLHPEHSKFVKMRQERGNNRYDRRGYNNQRSQSRDDVRIGVPGDPHANIMTAKEKDWVIHIQMMALQSDRPEIDDYYYQKFIERRLRDGKWTSNESSKTPQRLITPSKPNVENKKYVPVQFNNSLGKLTTSSVYNPRQIIDVVQATNQDEEEGESRQALTKRLVVYKKIEKAYDLIIIMEEIHRSLPTYEDATERELADDDLKIKTKLLLEILGFNDMMEGDASKDPIFQIMKIRKGKKLLARAMPFIPQNDRVAAILSILAHLPILIKRDLKDRALQDLYGSISHTISMVNVNQFLEILAKMSTFNLTAAVRDQVGVSIVCKILDRGRELYSFDNSTGLEQWYIFLSDVSVVMVTVANPKEGSRHARPTTPSPLLEEFPVEMFEILSQSSDDSGHLEILRSSVGRLIASTSGASSAEDVTPT